MNEQEKKDWVYAQLEDEESRFIYENKILFNESRDYLYIQKIIEKYLPEVAYRGFYDLSIERRMIKTIQERSLKIIIFGAGFQGLRFLHICMAQGAYVECFCDNALEKQNTLVEGRVPVFGMQDIAKKQELEKYAVVVSPELGRDQIRESLIENGIPKENIYLYNKPYIDASGQYFDNEIIKIKDNEIFVDGGCLDLGTSEIFLEIAEKSGYSVKKIYAFEPDFFNLKKCRERIKEGAFKNIDLINAGLWKCDTYLGFSSNGDGGSRIEEANSDNQIKVTSLDSCIEGRVTFIKMDIEGAELEALKGAEKCILTYKPKLAICIYHKREDMWEIPLYIKSLIPEYRLYIRHYSNCEWETVLYAVI